MQTSRARSPNVLWLVVCCQGAACSAPPAPSVRPEAPAGPHELVVEGVRVERWVEGQLRLSAEAARARADRRRGVLSAEGVALVARDELGAPLGYLSSHALLADLAGAQVELRGAVVLEDTHGRTLTATHAVYTSGDQRVVAPGRVQVQGANFRAEGRRLRADLGPGLVEVDGPLSARVQAKAP